MSAPEADAGRDLLVTATATAAAATGPAPRLATPLGLALVIPLLVLLSGLGITLLAWRTAREGAITQAGATLDELGRSSLDRSRTVFAGGRAAIDSLHQALQGRERPDDARLARILANLLRGRPGLAVLHVAFPDGGWCGVAEDAGRLRVLTLRRQPDGSRAMVEQAIDDACAPIGAERIVYPSYDPRLRPFWQAAVAAGRRAWTEPYVFASNAMPGISVAEPVADATGLQMVITADFDIASLGRSLDQDGRVETVIVTADQAILAMPPAWQARKGAILRPADLDRAEARAFFSALDGAGLPAEGRALALRFTDARGAEWGAAVRALRLPDGPTWYVARLADRDLLLGGSDAVLRHGLLLACAVLAVAVAAGTWFAFHLARARRETSRQRERARAAEQRARELGSYRLERRLGVGGMGEVWLARHRLLRRPAAMKLIAADRIGSDPDVRAAAIARFEREARITASLRSRSTIDLWDFGTAADGTWYYVMELLDGMDLRQLVGRHGPLPAGRIVHLLVQACASLGEAHDRGLVHRDIKPENLFACRLADEVDVLKVLDFGIVAEPQPAAGAAITRAGYINGTPGYMAPEQARARPLDGRADLYALGCVAYWLACGCDVFDGEPYELIAHQLSTAPTPPSRFVRDLPPGLEQLILDCLAKDPGQRPQNARVLAQRLRALDIPADAAWPPETAQAWWTAHLPPGGAA